MKYGTQLVQDDGATARLVYPADDHQTDMHTATSQPASNVRQGLGLGLGLGAGRRRDEAEPRQLDSESVMAVVAG